MSIGVTDLYPALPEIVLLAMACFTLVVDVYLPERYRHVSYQLAQSALVACAVLILIAFPHQPVTALGASFVADPMGAVLQLFILLVSFFAFFYARCYLDERHQLKGEFFVLGLFAVLGMLVLVAASSLITVYLGLELLSLSLYALVALHRDSLPASEAAMKYFVLGALASGMLLYGMSMVYGATGTLDLARVHAYIAGPGGPHDTVLMLGLVFLVIGVAFKLGAVPFHMWVPDVYEGAPTAVALFVGTAPKIAAFGMLMRLLVDGMGGMHGDWQHMLVILSVLSMGLGNIAAIAQTNIKRMLAYSTIGHVGFLFLGVIAGGPSGYGAAMFYIIAYVLSTATAFGMIIALGRAGFEADRLDDFKGLNERSPWSALLMAIAMFSLAGVPPLVGFWAKWAVLADVVAAGMTWLAVLAVIFSVIGLFYYLRVVKLMYFDEPEDKAPIPAGMDLKVMLSANALSVLILGVFPGALLSLCLSVMGG